MEKPSAEIQAAADLLMAELMDWAARADLIPELTNHLGPELTREALAMYERQEARDGRV